MPVIAVVVALLIVLYCGVRIERRRRTPAELRGDWWSAFEKEFGAYSARIERSRGLRRRRNDHGSIEQ